MSIKELLEGKSICVVGNSGREIGKDNGKKIDSFDYVLRFNNFEINGYENDYGSKTTHWVNAFCNDIRNYNEYTNKLKILSPLPLNDFRFLKRYRATEVTQLKNNLKRTEFIPVNYFLELISKINNPSSGAALLWWLHKEEIKLSEENVFGFSFFDKDEAPFHYFDKATACGHKGNIEKQLITGLFNKEIPKEY